MLLKNCRLIPELSNMCEFHLADVMIQGEKIEYITEVSSNHLCDDIIDCKGKTLLPGLFDLHAHISIASAKETPEDAMHHLVCAISRLQEYTKYGVTTIRDCGSTLRLALSLRDAVAIGAVKGPRILACGYMLAPKIMQHMGQVQTMTMNIANTAEEFRLAAQKELSMGADFIKLYASESASQSLNKEPKSILQRHEIRAVVEIAQMSNTYVAAHAHSLSSIILCMEEGVRSIEHSTFIDDDTIQRLKKYSNVYLTPTFAILASENSPEKHDMLKRSTKQIGNAYRAGYKMGFGTDLYNGDLKDFPQEFRIRKEHCGMKNVDILLQAIKYSAEIAGLTNVTGEIKPGLAADLILVDGNPDEDISIMYKKPLMVIQGGERRI